MHKKICYYSVNFYPIWTKICPRNPLHMPSIFHVRYTVPPMPLERDIAKFIKNGSIFYLIFRVYLVSQWNLGKMTSYTFHMLANWGPHANFQEFLTAHLRDRLLRYLFLYHSKGTKSAQDPTRASMVKVRQKTRPPRRARLNSRQGGAICLVIVFDNKTCKYNSFLKRNFFSLLVT